MIRSSLINADRALVTKFPDTIIGAVGTSINQATIATTTAVDQAKTEIVTAITGLDGKIDAVGASINQATTATATAVGQVKTDIVTTITGLDGKIDSVSKNLDSQLQGLSTICQEADKKVANLSGAISKIDGLQAQVSTAFQELQKLGLQILRTIEIKDISGKEFGAIRKCLQLLNRLEDWVLADVFDGNEYNGDEVNSLKEECAKHPQYSQFEGLLNDLLGDNFPRPKSSMEIRAKYYIKILNTRVKIISLAASVSSTTKQQ